jgi:hypothetical protein
LSRAGAGRRNGCKDVIAFRTDRFLIRRRRTSLMRCLPVLVVEKGWLDEPE